MSIESEFVVTQELLSFLGNNFGMTSNYLKNRLLWWDENHSDPRIFLSFNTFNKRLSKIGDYYVYKRPTIPMTTLFVDILGCKVPLFISARPFLVSEIKRSELRTKGLDDYIPDLFSDPGDDFIKRNLENEPDFDNLEREVKKLDAYFRPHVRGIYVGRDSYRAYYFPLPRIKNSSDKDKWRTNPEIEKLIIDGIHNLGYGKINTVIASGVEVVDRTKKAVIDLTYINAIKPKTGKVRSNMKLPFGQKTFIEVKNLDNFTKYILSSKGLEHVHFFDFPFSEKTSKNLVSFIPLEVNDEETGMLKTVPIAITNKDPDFDFSDGIYILGVYERNYRNELRVIPFTNPKFAINVSEQLAKSYNIPISRLNTGCLVPTKGQKTFQIIPHTARKYDSTIHPVSYLSKISLFNYYFNDVV